jgi:hypothetical protein
VTTIALLRTGHLNHFLHRADGSPKPWLDAELDVLLADAITRLWPRLGIWTTDDADTDSTTMLYTVPAAFGATFRISRIDLVNTDGLYVDRVNNWRKHDATQLLVRPQISTGLTLRFYGWIPFAVGTLLAELEDAVAHAAAARAYGGLAAELTNSERQQNLDSGRVVSYADAVGLAAYHERLFADAISDHPSKVSYSPRASHRR